MSAKPSFFAELQRRHVYKVGAMYAVAGWLLVQVITQVFPIFHVDDSVQRLLVLAIVAGFPAALVLSWIYDLTPQGIVRTDEVQTDALVAQHTGQRLNRAIIVLLLIAVLALLAKMLWPLNRDAAPPAETVNDKSIAVLPFVNMSGDTANEYFSDGITEEILNAAAQLPGLRVAARTSAFQFKGQNLDLRKVGDTLGVAYVLEGSVQRAGDEVRITAQLIDAHSGYHRWSGKFDRKLTSIFSIEDEIATAIVAQLQLQLADKHEGPLVKAGTANPQAHELYLKGIAQIGARGPSVGEAVQSLKQAVQLDPDYAAAWAALAQAQELLPWYFLGEWDDSLNQALAAAQKALALDASVAEAHAALATVLRDRAQYDAAGQSYRRALELNPGSSEILDQYAQYLFLIGRFKEGVDAERRAIAIDPLSPDPQLQLGMTLAMMHRYDEALAHLDAAAALEPNNGLLLYQLGFVSIYSGQYADAEQWTRRAFERTGADPELGALLIRAIHDSAQRPAALQALQTLRAGPPNFRMPPLTIWDCLLGDRAAALDDLGKWIAAADRSNIILGSFYFSTPALETVRGEPRYRAMLESVGLPAAAIETAGKEVRQ